MPVKIENDIIEEFLLRYMEGDKVIDIAKDLGVGKSTLYAMLKNDDIVKRLERDRRYIQNQTRAMILKDASDYVKELKKIAKNCSDARTKTKANETLLAYIIGTPTNMIQTNVVENTNVDSNVLNQLYNENDNGSNTNNNDTDEE